MNTGDDLQLRWWKLEEKMMQRFDKKPDVESILFLIGIQELGDIRKKFSKEQKQDLMHIAICTVLAPSGYYELSHVDEDGWPHFKQLKPMANMHPIEQENFLKDHILLYFQNHDFYDRIRKWMEHRKRCLLLLLLLSLNLTAFSQQSIRLKKKDRKRDVELTTSYGPIILRLSDSTPLHRDNFLRLVKSHYYDGVLFHRVIKSFMIQSGDPGSKKAKPGQALGDGGPSYTIPAEFRPTLFHKKGVLAAAREGDDVNPAKSSSGSQFYIVQGRTFTSAGLDSVETFRLKRKIPGEQRQIYTTLGGTPHLDQNYTVFGEVINGLNVVDSIAATPTSRQPADRPIQDMQIIKARLIKRKG